MAIAITDSGGTRMGLVTHDFSHIGSQPVPTQPWLSVATFYGSYSWAPWECSMSRVQRSRKGYLNADLYEEPQSYRSQCLDLESQVGPLQTKIAWRRTQPYEV
eukprot:475489-Pyramimonas_sp.AAC.1